MKKIREILRLAWQCGQSRKAIAASCGSGKTTVTDTIRRARAAGLDWPLPVMDDDELERLVYPPIVSVSVRKTHPVPDWEALHNDFVTGRDLTLMLLWQEYKEKEPKGYQYSQFCALYKRWRMNLDLSMRQEHRAGEKLFVDFCGRTIPIVDPETGAVREAQVFAAVMGASNFTYAEAVWSQNLADWTGVHASTFTFLGGVPLSVVPDNLASGVTKPCRYEPLINETYAEMAAHYGTAIMPARAGKPKDKSKVEVGVQIVQRFILAGLRKRTFFSLAEANEAIRERLDILNNRPFRKLSGTRLSRFLEIDCPALLPLPAVPYQFALWKKALVGIDYHAEVDGHHYSVPYRLRGEKVEARYTGTTVEFFHKNNRVASHSRSFKNGGHTTVNEHMHPSHRKYAEHSPESLIRRAETIGPKTVAVLEEILSRRAYPEHGFRSCLGIILLSKQFTPLRIEAACGRALAIRGVSYKSIRSILINGLDARPLPEQPELSPISHDNIRGGAYYNT